MSIVWVGRQNMKKAKRPDLKPIRVVVLMTKERISVSHEVWEGNQSE